VLLFGCKTKQQKISPVEENITESVYASGVVKSDHQYQVFSSVNGLVNEVMVNEGDQIRKGDPILRITNTIAQLNTENAVIAADYASVAANAEKLNELATSIDLARIKMESEASLLQRQKNLWEQQIGSRNEVDQRELAYKSAASAFQAAKLRHAQLQKQISFQEKQSQKNLQISRSSSGDYTIRSEVSGKVYSLLKKKGEMAGVQSPVAIIGDNNAFVLELQVDEYDIIRILPGQKVVVGMDSYKGQVFEAVVEKINPLMNERTKSFTVDARFTKPPPSLYPNLTCEANLVIREKTKALTIPRYCLLENDYVLMANREKRKVTTGLKDFLKVEILSGLTVNDIILKPAP
jgi:multidrug efflux pump subunit AcrA (membrane-fusion protein)